VVTADLAGLAMETKYAYRLSARNSIGANSGVVRTFTPHAVLGTETESATNITQTGATLNGSFDPNNESTHYYFEWGTDTSYGNVTAVPPGDDGGSTPGLTAVSTDIGELSAFTKYHYRIVATNSLGTSKGEDRTFVTKAPEVPGVSGTTVSDVGPGQATVSAEVTPGFGATVYLFEYGPTIAYGKTTETSDSIGADNTPHTVEVDLKGLAPGVNYHVRAVAINFGGTGHGADASFTTPSAPTIGESTATGVTQTAATLRAQVHPGLGPTTYYFEYGLTPQYGQSTPESGAIGSDASYHGVSTSIGNLAPGTDYHFRVVASNAVGVTNGPDQVFRTQARPASTPGPETSTPERCRKGFVKRGGRCVKRRCKRGFVRKGGRCVKRKKSTSAQRRKSKQGHGSRSHG
jgi:phosphodiesterase/alkaline phosphatase D-like protein